MKKAYLALLLVSVSLVSLLFSATPAQAVPNGCEAKLGRLFYDDYSLNSWSTGPERRVISWTAKPAKILDRPVGRHLNKNESKWFRQAIESWDEALTTVDFIEVFEPEADLSVGFVDQKLQGNIAVWNAWWNQNGTRHLATIRFRLSSDFLNSRAGFIQTAQHEIGNMLGLGDISPRKNIKSVMNDPAQKPSGRASLGPFDKKMIRQLYGEAPCTV